MTAFLGLSAAHTSNIQAVAPGIAEALITTAVGLVAAIPAQMFYNFLIARVRTFDTRWKTLSPNSSISPSAISSHEFSSVIDI